MKPSARKPFPIVAIGASAGGLKAFEALLSAVPQDSGMAFVLVPHLAPQHKSFLAEILGRQTRLPIHEVKNGVAVSPNRIYILPPNRKMRIKEGVLHLSAYGSRAAARSTIDDFFRSLAQDQGRNAIGVLLSGEGSDGTEGLRAIKDGGGATFAQDAKTAGHLGMPRSAAVSGAVDFVLSPTAIGRRLSRKRWEGAGAPPKKTVENAHRGGDPFDAILELLRSAKGIDFEFYKKSTLLRRITRRMAMRKIREPRMYLRLLHNDAREINQLYQDVLISVTSFFREPDSFEALKTLIYPRILKNRSAHAPIRIWVPGCSTGEEAYSHAINLVEFLEKSGAHVPFQIFATDVNSAVIEKARAGRYAAKMTAGVSSERLRRFFVEDENGYRISPAIRERCIFAFQNLVQDPPFTNLDLISCRNLLIYLGPTLQENALRIFQYALKPRGILMLGRSETIGDFSGRFSPLSEKQKIFSERNAASRSTLDFVRAGRFLETEPALKDHAPDPDALYDPLPRSFDLQGRLEGVLPARFIPNGVVVNADLEILRFLGNTSAYLRPAPGKPSMNLRRMASPQLLLELRAAITVSKKTGSAVRKDVSAPQAGGVRGRMRLEVLPFKAAPSARDYFLVLFEEIEEESGRGRSGGIRRGKDSRRVIELKEDLAVSGEHLKTIIEEQESTNARLKSSNEDLLSSNEELQSINEEYETTKEELQSSNEELISSTDEIVRGNQVLNRANSDLSNLLANIEIPVVLLHPDLTVHRFTPAAEKVLDLAPAKIGRSVLDINLPLIVPKLKRRLLDVLKSGQVDQLEVQSARGHWYELYLRPYRADLGAPEPKKIEGAVMALIDIHDRILAEKTLRRLATLVRDSNDAVIVRDLSDRISAWNKGAQEMYGYTEKEALGMKIQKLFPKDARLETRELFRLMAQAPTTKPVLTRRRTKGGRTLDVLLTLTLLRNEKGEPVEFATTERDITEQMRSAREFRVLHARVISAEETERKRLARELHDGVGQILSGVKFRLESLPGNVTLTKRATAKILKVGGFLDRAISEVRRVSQNLMPSELEDLGLEAALNTLCREFRERAGIAVTVRTVGIPEDISPDLALSFFRIAQEALNNIEKHSKATVIAVALACKGDIIILSVSDNGVGFNMRSKRPSSGRGIGLGNMRERAESVGGSLEVRSTPSVGTTLIVRAVLSGLPRGGGA